MSGRRPLESANHRRLNASAGLQTHGGDHPSHLSDLVGRQLAEVPLSEPLAVGGAQLFAALVHLVLVGPVIGGGDRQVELHHQIGLGYTGGRPPHTSSEEQIESLLEDRQLVGTGNDQRPEPAPDIPYVAQTEQAGGREQVHPGGRSHLEALGPQVTSKMDPRYGRTRRPLAVCL